MPIVSPAIEEYLLRVTPPGDALLEEMERLAAERRFPIVGPQVGRLLGLLARSIGARRVFECGSGFGYSAIWFARALPGDGRVVLTETRAENCEAARGFLERAGLLERCDVRQGDGPAILESEPGPFDIIFCDIDKRDYPKVHPLVGARLRRGGLLICDNMLWSGRVAGPDQDDDTRGVRELTRRLYADPGLETTLLPLRDGVSVSLRR
ncbi:MAG TPA: O-methyltransferase [Candidatus Polarisedimenticolia bacterium]|nr:O-methyltransferase [Candidatus Polarisedimenticolia bacterium]